MKNEWQKVLLVLIGIMISCLICLGIDSELQKHNNILEDNKEIDKVETNDNEDENIKYIWCNNEKCEFNDSNNDVVNYNYIGTFKCTDINNCNIDEEFINQNKILINDNNIYYVYDLNNKKSNKLTSNDLLNLGYKEENLNSNDLSSNIYEFKDSDLNLSTLNNNQSYVIDEEYKYDNVTQSSKSLRLVFQNNKLYLVTDSERQEINIPNIKTVYIQSFGSNIYILTNDGIVYYFEYSLGSDINLSELASSYHKIESNYKYEKLYLWHMGIAGDGYYYSILGEDTTGKKYVLKYDMPFDNLKINYGEYVITKDNYFYDYRFDNTSEEFNNLKVDKVFSKIDDNMKEFIVFFENNEIYKFTNLI